MDCFDKYMVSLVGEGRYGRYVDDAYVVGTSPAELRRIIPHAETFLREKLGLRLSRNKIAIQSAYRGVEFLGAYLKPFRRYVARGCLRRMEGRFPILRNRPPESVSRSLNSCLGITSHYAAYRIRERWIRGPLAFAFEYGYFMNGILKYRRYAGNTGLNNS